MDLVHNEERLPALQELGDHRAQSVVSDGSEESVEDISEDDYEHDYEHDHEHEEWP